MARRTLTVATARFSRRRARITAGHLPLTPRQAATIRLRRVPTPLLAAVTPRRRAPIPRRAAVTPHPLVPTPRQAAAQVAAAIVAAVAVRADRVAVGVAADRIAVGEVLTAAAPTAANFSFDPRSPLLNGSGLFLF